MQLCRRSSPEVRLKKKTSYVDNEENDTHTTGSTFLGGLLVYLFDDITPAQNAAMLGFAGGVMLTLSALDMMLPAVIRFGFLPATMTFAVGFLLTVGISKFLANHEVNWNWLHRVDDDDGDSVLPLLNNKHAKKKGAGHNSRLLRSALLTTAALAIHNAPEGVAVGLTVLSSTESNHNEHHSFLVVVAIALHNIPEGIAVAAALLQATNRRVFSCVVAGITGLVEPLSAVLAVMLLESNDDDSSNHEAVKYMSELMIAGVAGVMVQVSITELVPQARAASPKAGTLGLLAGSFAVILSLRLLGEL